MKTVQISYNTDDVQEYSSYSSAVSYANLCYITSESDTEVVKLVSDWNVQFSITSVHIGIYNL